MRKIRLRTTPSSVVLVALGIAPALLAVGAAGCKEPPRVLIPKTQSLAELRTIKRGVKVAAPNEKERAPFPRERLVDGENVSVVEGGLAWLRRDGGATLLVAGPATLTLEKDDLVVKEGRVFVDALAGLSTELKTPKGSLHLSDVRASLEVKKDGDTRAYVLKGAVRSDDGTQAGPGEELELAGAKSKPAVRPVRSWEDWTGGLATTDQEAQPAPFGVGTVGARTPGAQGQPRFPLAIQKMEVRVKIDHDFAVTEVEQVFFNPSAETVEGIYNFRTPPGATLHRFGVDRNDGVVWGRVKEKQAAAAQYQANVYQGSTEDPALLEWVSPGVYKARLYPIKGGETRRVITRYGEWLSRNGDLGERRLYVYPMAAEGADGTLPKIEELSIFVDLARANAKETRVGMRGALDNQAVTVRAHDLTPRADFALELFDDGLKIGTAYRASHKVELDMTAYDQRAKAVADARQEMNNDYVLVPVRPTKAVEPPGGLDLAIVIDASAATDLGSLAVARSMTGAILSHLGKEDRAAVWAADATLRPVIDGSGDLSSIDAKRREAIVTGLAKVDRGGATDLGAVISAAASKLDGTRRGAVVYIGDGRPTVGELSVGDLRDRLQRLPRPVRLFTVGVGDEANMAVLKGIARGAFADRVTDAYSAAKSALRLLEEAERPVWMGASVDLGQGVDRVYPREMGAIAADEAALVVGRVASGSKGDVSTVTIRGAGGESSQAMITMPIEDDGNLRRRWAEGRLVQLLDEGAGRSAIVEVGTRFQIITPFTSLYVPTANEVREERRKQRVADVEAEDEDVVRQQQARANQIARELKAASQAKQLAKDTHQIAELEAELDRIESQAARSSPKKPAFHSATSESKEGGTGTRAQREEGAMGKADAKPAGAKYGVKGAADAPAAPAAADGDKDKQKSAALKEASEFGVIGLLNAGAAPGGAAAPAAQPLAPAPTTTATAIAQTTTATDSDNRKSQEKPAEPSRDATTAVADEKARKIEAAPLPMAAKPTAAAGPGGGKAAANAPGDPLGGNMWGSDIGDAFGSGGLGLSGIGDGGGGKGEGIGLGGIGTLGHGAGTGTGQGFGSGSGRLGGEHKASGPSVRMGAVTVTGKLPPEVIQRIVRQNFGRFRMCYENGLRNNPNLAGKVSVKFVIGRDGAVASVNNGGSDLPDGAVVNCVVRAFNGLSFPQPEGGTVTVTYPISFSPEGGSSSGPTLSAEEQEQKKRDAEAAQERAKIVNIAAKFAGTSVTLMGEVGHSVRLCGAAANLPLEERAVLWRERLVLAGGNASSVRDVFYRALDMCEAPTWRERYRLLSLMVDALPDVRRRVELWRYFSKDRSVGDSLYRLVVLRVHTANELKDLHQALGLKKIDPTLLEKELEKAKTPGDRAIKLKELIMQWPDDLDLALKLLDAYEDMNEMGAGRAWARDLRRRGDANAKIRTSVGEFYFRASKKAGGSENDISEARRSFGELVEFAPQDPVARRRLGDLLRAHGFYDEAFRQYETLARLTPDDSSVPLLLAFAAQGMGRTEEAIRWTEKAAAANAPDGGGSGRTSRAFASVFLAWARDEAAKAGRNEEAERLRERARRLTSLDIPVAAGAKTMRVVLTWSHPELHPVFWSNALGALMPAPDGDAFMGVAQVMMPATKSDAAVEIKFEKDDAETAARLGVEAVITVLVNEGNEGEKILRLPVVFKDPTAKVRKFKISDSGIVEN